MNAKEFDRIPASMSRTRARLGQKISRSAAQGGARPNMLAAGLGALCVLAMFGLLGWLFGLG